MEVIKTPIEGLLIIEPKVFKDERGYFFESFSQREFDEKVSPILGYSVQFVQDNESMSSYGVMRGLHYQRPPFTQSKLLRCVRGAVLDVAVDIRKDSPTFGQHVAVELSEENHRQFFVPKGFAHGFAVLTDTAVFQYKCDEFYHPEADAGINIKDENLGIDWRIPVEKAILSARDLKHPYLVNLTDYVQTGEGANGLSYDCISDDSVMVKLYKTDFDKESIYVEYEVSEKVYSLGIPVPKPYYMVTDGERLGIKFEKIKNKRSFARAISQQPEHIPEFATEFAKYCKRIHSTVVPEGMFPDCKPDFLRMLQADTCLTDAEKAKFENFIKNVIPDCKTALHGDMHVGNFLTTLAKDVPPYNPHKVYFIDLGYFAYGCPLIDIGMMYSMCLYCDDDFLISNLHFGRDVAKQVWNYFAQEYFFGEEKLAEKWFGAGATMDDVMEGLKPYVATKMLLIEYNAGFMPPSYLDFYLDAVRKM